MSMIKGVQKGSLKLSGRSVARVSPRVLELQGKLEQAVAEGRTSVTLPLEGDELEDGKFFRFSSRARLAAKYMGKKALVSKGGKVDGKVVSGVVRIVEAG